MKKNTDTCAPLMSLLQWYAGKCLTVDSLENKELWFIVSAPFCYLNTPTIANS